MITTDAKNSPLSLEALIGTSYLSSHNAPYLEMLLEQYQQDDSTLTAQWRACLSQLVHEGELSHAALIQTNFSVVAQRHTAFQNTEEVKSAIPALPSLQALIHAFRCYGHLCANLDPLNLKEKSSVPELNPQSYGFAEQDLSTVVPLNGTLGLQSATLSEVLVQLQALYCGKVGIEYEHILDTAQKQWLIERIERPRNALSVESRKRILHRLIESEGLEKHLGSQFVAQKRFSIEGGDSLMPMLDTLAQHSSQHGTQSLVVGMGHRGRLNVLINFFGKSPSQLFEEFKGGYKEGDISGDVKYHKGFRSLLRTEYGALQASLAYNPSHLECVDAVVEGIARAEQDQRIEESSVATQEVLPILMHGDAAFAGQGIVVETLQLSQTQGYGTGGTIHIISNNQVGFTTDPTKARSTRYCSDIAKGIEVPVFHVNGDDPEAACWVAQIALEFRMRFQKDVVIDLVCYRRYGHNEADEPAATQPKMYEIVRQHPPVWAVYAERLRQENVIQSGEAENWLEDYRKRVATGNPVASLLDKQLAESANTEISSNWRQSEVQPITQTQLQSFANPLADLPPGMELQTQVANVVKDRRKMMNGELPMNWGTAEMLAYASLLSEGWNIRLTGQDCERGTFSHRHAILHDNKTGELTHSPLLTLTQHPKQFTLCNSILSEAAVMGFEYGYACTRPQSLVIWEAQFGDFCNSAQVIIDQFLSASEQKWGQRCGLVLLLPHGYEGAGPEHSSARLERFLQLCAQENMQVCVPTTPAQQFHLLRRQALRRDYQKPLIVMTPKSLLRHKQAISELSDLSEKTSFQAVIPWAGKNTAKKCQRVILCSGKVYYDLLAEQVKTNEEVAIIRLEQLYPFPDLELRAALKPYQQVASVVWCQEEPKNQGAWQWIRDLLENCVSNKNLSYVGRSEAASTATGSPLRHTAEQTRLVREALAL